MKILEVCIISCQQGQVSIGQTSHLTSGSRNQPIWIISYHVWTIKSALVRHSINLEHRIQLQNKWVDNIKMDLRETGWGGMGWVDLAQDRDQQSSLLIMVMNLQVPQNVGKFLSRCTTGGF
jgi:hypothetical protein